MTMPLARRAADVPAVFAARFNSGDITAVAELYETGSVMGGQDGRAVDGDGRLSILGGHMALGAAITVAPRKVLEADGIALLVVDWVIGEDLVRGTATDVARRGADGYWRYAVDNPFGTA
ncbi:DUF4440 domain-containing protein [Phytomonospora endophytica]|uniref:Ketosteroid isomerase-like protein n=1 Tax=Phytomonospora endophytica TaxID=714109 RepID=A0A841FKT8_9ACTN|nr:DUF4440 domain-containing protein [Phytomonospora endophytica]MBB6033797.1 ketosteroid isomerase-like protein [Phytomonospora endophytica]GIG64685.1 hypothetical protein Pen01_09800 [Phytomonospora endophytica]